MAASRKWPNSNAGNQSARSSMEAQKVDSAYYRTRKYRLRWWTLAVLSVSLVVIGLDNTILNVALPAIQKELGASSSQLQWMVDAYVLVFASLLLTMGALGDRFGRKRTLQIGLVIFGAGMVRYGGAFDVCRRHHPGSGLHLLGDAFPSPDAGSFLFPKSAFLNRRRGDNAGFFRAFRHDLHHGAVACRFPGCRWCSPGCGGCRP
ncbi:MAG: MFS transporter [Thermoleophilia bacterium]